MGFLRSTALTMVVFIGIADGSSAGQLSMPVSAVRNLSAKEQRQVVHDALNKRAEMLSNVHVKARIENFGAPYSTSSRTVGTRGQTISRDEQEYWSIDSAYRYKATSFPKDASTPLFSCDSHFDSDKGVTRMLGKHAKLTRFQGRISNIHDNASRFNQYLLQCLPGYLDGNQPSQLQYLLDTFDQVETIDNAAAGVDLPDTIVLRISDYSDPKQSDTRTYWIEPAKDFMIVRLERRNDRQEGKTHRFLHSDIWVIESTEIDGIQVPRNVQWVGWSNRTKPDNCGVSVLTMTEMHIGKVKPSDLVVEFPDGTEVIDDFQQRAYVTGQVEKPLPLVNVQGIGKTDVRRALPWGIILNVTIVVGLAAILAMRKRRSRLKAA